MIAGPHPLRCRTPRRRRHRRTSPARRTGTWPPRDVGEPTRPAREHAAVERGPRGTHEKEPRDGERDRSVVDEHRAHHQGTDRRRIRVASQGIKDGAAHQSVGDQRDREPHRAGAQRQGAQPLALRSGVPDQVAKARREHHHTDVDALVHEDAEQGHGVDVVQVASEARAVVHGRRVSDDPQRELQPAQRETRQGPETRDTGDASLGHCCPPWRPRTVDLEAPLAVSHCGLHAPPPADGIGDIGCSHRIPSESEQRFRHIDAALADERPDCLRVEVGSHSV